MFNSLGNLLVDERVGLAFLDFSNERLIQDFMARADIQFDDGAAEPAIGHTRRSVNVSIDGWSDAPLDAAARWEDLEGSA